MDASHDSWKDDPADDLDSIEGERQPSPQDELEAEGVAEDDFYVLLDFEEAEAVAGTPIPRAAGAHSRAFDTDPLAESEPSLAAASATGATAASPEEDQPEWLLRGPEEVEAANAEPFEGSPEIPSEILTARAPRGSAFGRRDERGLRKMLVLGSIGAGALLFLSAGLVYMKKIVPAPRKPTSQHGPLVAKGPDPAAATPRPIPPPAVVPADPRTVEPPALPPPAPDPVAPPVSTAPEPEPAPVPTDPEAYVLDPTYLHENPDRPRIAMPPTLPETDGAAALPETAGPVSVRTPEGGFVLLKAGQVLVALRNGNHFVGRIYRINMNELVLRLPTGEIVLGTRTLSKIVPLVGAKEPGIESMPDGFVELENGNRIWGKILEESDDVVAIGFASARITIPRAAVSAVGHGSGTAVEFVEN